MSNPLSEATNELSFRDLQAKAKDMGLSASGTREELEARIAEASDSIQNQPAAVPPVAPTPEARPADVIHRETALNQKAYNDAQPKVAVFIPFNDGENPEMAKQIPFIVNINGWRMEIPRGVMTEVPVNVQQIIQERLESEGKAGRSLRIDQDASKMAALG